MLPAEKSRLHRLGLFFLAHFEDFLALQVIIGTAGWISKDERLRPAVRKNKSGGVIFDLHVDASGKFLSIKVLSEDPPGYNFAAVEKDALSSAKFIPGFRNDKAVDCTFQMTRYIWIVHTFGGGGGF